MVSKTKLVTAQITPDMTISTVVETYPEVIETLMSFGVHCVGCCVAGMESLHDGFASHGMDEQAIDACIKKLNEVASSHARDAPAKSARATPQETEVLHITKEAAIKAKEILKEKPDHAFRIRVVPGGCSGYTYAMALDKNVHKDDVVVEKDVVKVLLDSETAKMIHGSKMEYIDSLQGAGFKLSNPNATKSCGCGKSFG